jgi:DNA (cytosine-5)-methyltransferase 1
MLRVISEIKPTYVVGENVRGLTNWNGGVVFEEVCTDLENKGYTVQPILLPACSVGAPHRRDRVWFVASNTNSSRLQKTRSQQQTTRIEQHGELDWNAAYSKGIYAERIGEFNNSEWESNSKIGEQLWNKFGSNGSKKSTTNSNSIRQHKRECNNEKQPSERRFDALNDINKNDGQGNVANTNSIGYERWKERESTESKSQSTQKQLERFNQLCRANFEMFPSQSPICGGDDGLPTELDGITFSKWRQESIKGYGNAIVPQVAYEIFKVIAEMDRLEKLQLKLF